MLNVENQLARIGCDAGANGLKRGLVSAQLFKRTGYEAKFKSANDYGYIA